MSSLLFFAGHDSFETVLKWDTREYDITSTSTVAKQMDGTVTCDSRAGLRTLLLISCMGLRAKDQRWRSDWVVEISGLTGDNRLSVGKPAQSRNSFSIHTSYWPVAYDSGLAQYAWYWVALLKPDSFTFACCVWVWSYWPSSSGSLLVC